MLDHLADKVADGIHGDGHVGSRQQLADEAIRGTLLTQLHDAVFEEQQFRVTARADGREVSDSFANPDISSFSKPSSLRAGGGKVYV